MPLTEDQISARRVVCMDCDQFMRLSDNRAYAKCRARGASENRECPRCWAKLDDPNATTQQRGGCPLGKWPGISLPVLATLPAVTFPIKHGTPEWIANFRACRGCPHHRVGSPNVCEADNVQTSTHAMRGSCPTKRQPYSTGTRRRVPPPPVTVDRPFPSNVGKHRPAAPVPPAPTFPIDLVYTWVDGSDPAWQASWEQAFGKPAPGGSRYFNADELKYSLRSVERFAPWINRVFIVTSGQVPAWLNRNHPRVQLVTHAEIIPAEYLPTFNSAAIEAHIWKIPALSEHFLLANDDMLFGSDVLPGHFFAPDGKALVRLGWHVRGKTGAGGYQGMLNQAADILDRLFGEAVWRRGQHFIKPYRRSMLEKLEQLIPEQIRGTSSSRLRSGRNVAWNCGLWPAYSVKTGYAVPAKHSMDCIYLQSKTRSEPAMRRAIERMPHLLCVNNTASEKAARLLQRFLGAYFPAPSEFERYTWANPPRVSVEIVTGANTGQEDLLPFWLACLRRHHPQMPVLFVDFGMSDSARAWCRQHGRIVAGRIDPDRSAWFGKPRAILQSVGKRVVWLDADVEVVGDISPLWTLPTDGVLLAADDVVNPKRENVGNTGVCATAHGAAIIEQWAERCRVSGERSDQEVLYDMGVRPSLPPSFGSFDRRAGALVVHHASLRRKKRLRRRREFRGALAEAAFRRQHV